MVTPLMTPLVEAVAQAEHVSEHVLWGNVSSALAGTVPAIGRSDPGTARQVRGLVREVLRHAPLAGRGAFDRDGAFRRRSCGLFYRLPGGGYCADCLMVARPSDPGG